MVTTEEQSCARIYQKHVNKNLPSKDGRFLFIFQVITIGSHDDIFPPR